MTPTSGRSRPPILIIGAHRSGTTATARALQLLGLQLGEKLDSHLEPWALQKLHEEYLHHFNAAWHHPGPFLAAMQTAEGRQHCGNYLRENVERNFAAIFGYRRNVRGLWRLARLKSGKAWGWKDPRTTLFAPSWLDVFPGARILHVVRHPLAAATSIQRRELGFQSKGDRPTGQIHDLDYCLNLAVTYIEAGEKLRAQTSDYLQVRFEDIQANPSKRLADLATFCGLRFNQRQMGRAAASIRPDKSSAWRTLPNGRELLSRHPIVAKLGYDLAS